MEYYEHETYGYEDNDNKVITLSLDKSPTPEQWEDFMEDLLQLDMQFEELGYCDGEHRSEGGRITGFENEYEKTDTCPRGLVGYVFDKNTIRIWATEAIEPDHFVKIAGYILEKCESFEGFANAQVSDIGSSGLAISFTGSSLKEIANTIAPAQKSYKPSGGSAPGMAP